MARRRADVVVHSPDGALQLEVEVKTRSGASAEWAARLLRNMIVHQATPAAPYFMLVLPERIYLWNLGHHVPAHLSASELERGPEPDFEADSALALGPYLGHGETLLSTLEKDSLILLVACWLTNVLEAEPSEVRAQVVQSDLSALLLDSGLYGAARRGVVVTEAVIS